MVAMVCLEGKFMKKIFVLLFIGILVFSSCHKEKNSQGLTANTAKTTINELVEKVQIKDFSFELADGFKNISKEDEALLFIPDRGDDADIKLYFAASKEIEKLLGMQEIFLFFSSTREIDFSVVESELDLLKIKYKKSTLSKEIKGAEFKGLSYITSNNLGDFVQEIMYSVEDGRYYYIMTFYKKDAYSDFVSKFY